MNEPFLFGTLLHYMAFCRDVLGDPDITTNDRIGTDEDAAQNRGSSINGDAITDDWVAVNTLDDVPFIRLWEGARSKGDPLVNFYIIPNNACRPNNDPCSMINEKATSNFSARMNIDTGKAVAYFGH